MRTIPAAMKALWEAGGPFIGDDGRPNGYVTVQPDWTLTDASVPTSDATKLPFRWWQLLANTQTEIVVPGVEKIVVDRTLDADADSCDITQLNVFMGSSVGNPGGFGIPGYYTAEHGQPDAAARWGQVANTWAGVLIPNQLVRTYQGYGGWNGDVQNPLSAALLAGNVILTGVWLIDEVTPSTDGRQTIHCRDMMKLLIEQPLYVDLVPTAWYPLAYHRWDVTEISNPAITVYSFSNPVQSGPGAEGNEYISDITMSADGKGYWLVGTDGGVFSFGVPFWGSRGAVTDDGPMVSIAADPLNQGYWLCTSTGGVFTFGNVQQYGNPHGSVSGTIVKMAAAPDGLGYWLVSDNGSVYSYGSAGYHGGNPAGASAIVDICPTPSGLGYWLLDWAGHIYTFGDAVYFGNGVPGIDPFVGMARTSKGDGYWLAHQSGVVDALGAATLKNPTGNWPLTATPAGVLNDPIFAIAAMPTNNGYTLAGGDGGVFCFGDAPFYGSLPAGFSFEQKVNAVGIGAYADYGDIVKDIVRWCGFLAGGSGDDSVFGTIEMTGAYSEDFLPLDMFDKLPAIDPIKKIRELIGYITYCDEEGGFNFRQPNWYALGNLLEDNTRVSTIPVIDERVQLTNWRVPSNDQATRSKIIIATSDPAAGMDEIISSEKFLSSPYLRNMRRPAMWVNGAFTDAIEVTRMLNLVVRHLDFAKRPGVATCVMNPAIQVNDQVRVYERQTAETAIHYVRAIHHEMTLAAGAGGGTASWMMQLTTSWLGEAADFVIG